MSGVAYYGTLKTRLARRRGVLARSSEPSRRSMRKFGQASRSPNTFAERQGRISDQPENAWLPTFGGSAL